MPDLSGLNWGGETEKPNDCGRLSIDFSPHLVFFPCLTALSPGTPIPAMAFGRTKTTTKTKPVAKGGTAG